MDTDVELVAQRELTTAHGHFRELLFVVDGLRQVAALVHGDLSEQTRVLGRVHSFCYSGHALLSRECNCLDQMHDAQESIVAEGAGIIVVLDQDGRGFGHQASILAHELVASGLTLDDAYMQLEGRKDGRDFTDAANALLKLGVYSVRLITENPRKAEQLRTNGIDVEIASSTIADPRG